MTHLAVAVIAGGPSAEAAVSHTSAGAVCAALHQAGHAPVLLELDAELPAALRARAFDVAFPVTHGPLGEDGCLQGLLEVMDVPYVGSAVRASALAAHKPSAKVCFRNAGLPVAREAMVFRGQELGRRARQVREVLGPAVVVKPASGGSAIGVVRVRESDKDAFLVEALKRALEVDSTALVERFILGHEVTCGILEVDATGPRPLPPTLILSKAADWYDFRSRYATGGSEHRCPAPFPDQLNVRIQEVALGAHRALGARDLSRVDILLADDGLLTLLEVNTLPGMTSTSLFPEAAAATGLPFPELCDRLVRCAHARPRRELPPVVPMPD